MQFFLHEPYFHNTRIKFLSWAAEFFRQIGRKLVVSVGNYLTICGITRQPLTMQVWGPGRDHLVEPAANSPAGDDSGGAQHSQVSSGLYSCTWSTVVRLWIVYGLWLTIYCLCFLVIGSWLLIYGWGFTVECFRLMVYGWLTWAHSLLLIGWWLMVDGLWLIGLCWWLKLIGIGWCFVCGLMVCGWLFLVDGFWLIIYGSWFMVNGWRFMVSGLWLMAFSWWFMFDGNIVHSLQSGSNLSDGLDLPMVYGSWLTVYA